MKVKFGLMYSMEKVIFLTIQENIMNLLLERN